MVSPIHAAYMAKPAQPSLNEQGEHARYSFVLEHPCLGFGLARWCPKSFWGNAGGRCWVCALGGSGGSGLATMQQGAEHSGRGTPSSWCWWSTWLCPRPSFGDVPVLLCFVIRLFSSVSGRGRGCWRWWSLGKWSPPPPRECSRRWRCLGCCWRLGQGCWSFCDWWWDQTRYKWVQRW